MTTKRKINISIIVFILFAALFFFLVILPLAKDIKKNSTELLVQKKAVVDYDAQKKNLEQFKVFTSLFDENFQKIEDLFIDQDVPVEFIQFLEGSAIDSNLRIIITSSGKNTAKEDAWPFLSFQISVVGFFPDFMKFFEKIENSDYLVETQNLHISVGDAGKIDAEILLKVFAQK